MAAGKVGIVTIPDSSCPKDAVQGEALPAVHLGQLRCPEIFGPSTPGTSPAHLKLPPTRHLWGQSPNRRTSAPRL